MTREGGRGRGGKQRVCSRTDSAGTVEVQHPATAIRTGGVTKGEATKGNGSRSSRSKGLSEGKKL